MGDIRSAARQIMGIDVGSGVDQFPDNLAIALCSYFEDLPTRPEDDEDDGETWSPWVREQYSATEKSIVDFIDNITREACASRNVEIAKLRATIAQMTAAIEQKDLLP